MSFFCSFPFKNIHIEYTGYITPCCVWTSNINETVGTYFSSEQMAKVQEQLIKNQVPPQCIKCHDEEKRSGHSFRTMNQDFENSEPQIQKHTYPQFDIEHIQIITSNICNLMCLPCYSSSYIRNVELNKLGIQSSAPKLKTFKIEHAHNFNLSDYKSLKSITFLGGEPFADKITFQLIDQLIKNGQSKKVRLDLNTNLTLCNQENLLKIRDNFDSVMIKGSIDGIGKFNDYLRYPSNWKDIEQAIELIQELEIPMVITTALSNLSLLRYDQLIQWSITQGIEYLFLSKVTHPSVLAFDFLPNKIKMQLLERFLNLRDQNQYTDRTQTALDTCIEICSKSNKESNLVTLKNWLEKHDISRNTNFRDLWPELNDYL